MSVIERVCPRCGSAANAGDGFCGSCGLDLSAQSELPSRQEWLAGHPADRWAANGVSVGDAQAAPATARVSHAPQTEVQPGRPRSARLLGAGGLTVSGSMVLSAIGSLLLLVDLLSRHTVAGLSIAQGFGLMFPLLFTAGAALIGAGFLVGGDARSRLCQTGSTLAAGGLFSEFVCHAIVAGVYAGHDASGTLIAARVVWALGFAVTSVSALVAATAVGITPAGWNRGQRSGRLGSASIVVGAGVLLLMIGDILEAIAISGLSGYSAGQAIDAGGLLVLICGAVIAAVAFLLASRQERADAPIRSRKDTLLWVAAAVSGVAFLMVAVGDMVAASSLAGAGADGKIVAATWLDAVNYVGWVAAFSCASIGFFLSSRRAT